MGRKKTSESLYIFLEQQGVLDTADDASIRDAKKKYWAEYKRTWRQTKRQQSKTFSVLVTPKEAQRIAATAEQHHTSPTNFVKQLALAHCDKRPLVDAVLLGEIRALLALQYNLLQTVVDDEQIPAHLGYILLDRMATLERQVLEFINPKKSTGT